MIDLFPFFLGSDGSLNTYCDKNCRDTLQKIWEAAFLPDTGNGDVFFQDSNEWYRFSAILMNNVNRPDSFWPEAGESFLHDLDSALHCPANVYIGLSGDIGGIRQAYANMQEMKRNDLGSLNHVQLQSAFRMPHDSFEAPDMNRLAQLFACADFDGASAFCSDYLDQLTGAKALSHEALSDFQIDVVQALYSFLGTKGIQARRLYRTEDYHTLSVQAVTSRSSLELYFQYIFMTAKKYVQATEADKSVADIIREYVDTHYMEDISRESLEHILYFDPDYASRLFKKETGISFMNYVIQKRLEMARQLLETTRLPISAISSKVGYDNYSYFTRLFRKETGKTPAEYRMAATTEQRLTE